MTGCRQSSLATFKSLAIRVAQSDLLDRTLSAAAIISNCKMINISTWTFLSLTTNCANSAGGGYKLGRKQPLFPFSWLQVTLQMPGFLFVPPSEMPPVPNVFPCFSKLKTQHLRMNSYAKCEPQLFPAIIHSFVYVSVRFFPLLAHIVCVNTKTCSKQLLCGFLLSGRPSGRRSRGE